MLAHQGGWDEILMVAGPIAVIALFLVIATRRTRHLTPPSDVTPPSDAASPPSD